MTGTAMRPAVLRNTMRGALIEPGHPDYDAARSLWNGDIDRRPAFIARCGHVDDVAVALAFARTSGLEVAVRGGGHSVAGASSCEGGMVLDLSRMRQVWVDPKARRARCGGGATMADLDVATQAHGLAVTGGIVSHTGVGGLALGGGYGYLTGKAGLLIDNLLSAQVVLADGSIVRADAQEHPDLFWALRGGGGNFGVVTEFEFALHPVGPLVQVASLFWELDRSAEALRVARDVCSALSREAGGLIGVTNAPPESFVPDKCHFAPVLTLTIVGFGDADEHDARVQETVAAVKPAYQLAGELPYTALQQRIDPAAQWGLKAYSKGLYLSHLSDPAIDVIAAHLPARRSPFSVMPMFPLGGAYADAGEDDTALAGSRSARFNISIDSIAPTSELFDADRDWVRSLWSALQPFAAGWGGYVNFMGEYEDGRVRAAYGHKYQRLAQVKAEYDPANVFHLNANIKPATSSSPRP
jgi:FAD/FMN-containing dehydrogenase